MARKCKSSKKAKQRVVKVLQRRQKAEREKEKRKIKVPRR